MTENAEGGSKAIKKQNAVKKIIAGLCVITLTAGVAAAALAGSVMEAIRHAGSMVWESAKTVGQAVCDTCDYVFTDDDADTAYRSTNDRAERVNWEYAQMVNSGKQIKKDAEDIVEGGRKVGEGAEDFVENVTPEDVLNIIRGKEVKTDGAKDALEKMKEGYGRMDNDLVLEAHLSRYFFTF